MPKAPQLNNCPMCNARPDIQKRTKPVRAVYITCSKLGCRDVLANTLKEAAEIWNQPLSWK